MYFGERQKKHQESIGVAVFWWEAGGNWGAGGIKNTNDDTILLLMILIAMFSKRKANGNEVTLVYHPFSKCLDADGRFCFLSF